MGQIRRVQSRTDRSRYPSRVATEIVPVSGNPYNPIWLLRVGHDKQEGGTSQGYSDEDAQNSHGNKEDCTTGRRHRIMG
eukprot:11591657-Karenia_brevis.AAC.1